MNINKKQKANENDQTTRMQLLNSSFLYWIRHENESKLNKRVHARRYFEADKKGIKIYLHA